MSATEPKIVGTIGMMLGLPYVARQFLTSMLCMQARTMQVLGTKGMGVSLGYAQAPDLAHNRNTLAAAVDGDHLLMLDADAAFDPDLYVRMTETMYNPPPAVKWDGAQWVTTHLDPPLDVVTGLYFMRRTHHPVLYQWKPGETGPHQLYTFPLTEVFPVGSAGGGCLMVRKVVFDRIREELGRKPFDNRYTDGRLYEDHSFFLNLRDLDPPVQAYCNPRIVVRHLETLELDYQHYNASAPPAAGVMEIAIPKLAELAQ